MTARLMSPNGPKLNLLGMRVALSGDGNTAIIGGSEDNSATGAAWVYTRSGGVWTQQGSKLVGTGAIGNAQQGISVALSADGNTAIVGGPDDNSSAGNNSGTGAFWVFTRSGGVWSQQGKRRPPTALELGSRCCCPIRALSLLTRKEAQAQNQGAQEGRWRIAYV
jgi:hypothetical protein